MAIKKSPVYWEKLREMDVPTLRESFAEAAEIDLHWAVDQAKCLAYHVASGSEQANVVRAFCDKAAVQALEQGDTDTALTAMQLAADDPGFDSEQAGAAAFKLRQILDELVQTKREHALGLAVLLNAKTRDNKAMHGQIVDFLLTEAGHNYGILLNIVRSGAILQEEQLGKLLVKIGRLSFDSPYEARDLFCEMIDSCDSMTSEQGRKLLQMKEGLEDSPEVMLEILKRDYDEDITGLERLRRVNPLQFLPESRTIH